MSSVPVGRYELVVAPGTVGDSVDVVRIDTSEVTLRPDETVVVTVAVSFPKVSVIEARAATGGGKLFVDGIVIASLGVFGDTTLHVADTGAAIRATRVRRGTVLAGDSVRLLGTPASREGQPVLDDVSVIVLDINRLIPPAEVVTTGVAASADGGRLDAGLAEVRNVTIADTATNSVGFVLTVGVLEILLDTDIVFDLTGLDPGVAIDATGVLVPAGGSWQLKPRGNADVVKR
jgi:hypothetical protein